MGEQLLQCLICNRKQTRVNGGEGSGEPDRYDADVRYSRISTVPGISSSSIQAPHSITNTIGLTPPWYAGSVRSVHVSGGFHKPIRAKFLLTGRLAGVRRPNPRSRPLQEHV
jgi:hypothetical protein